MSPKAATSLPSVSVIIPTHNREHSIRATLLSVLEQTLTPTEIIVVDDASTDDTVSVLETLSGEVRVVPIRYERHATNKGGGAARNTGVGLAQGDLIAFLDSDDLWRPEKLTKQIQAWMESENPERTVVYCALETINGWRQEIRRGIPSGSTKPLADAMFVDNSTIQTSCLLLPKPLALEVPIDESLRAHQDLYLVLALERKGAKFLYIDEPLVEYDTSPSQGRISGERRPDASLLFLEKYKTWLSEKARLGFKARYLSVRLGQSGRPFEAISILTKALLKGVISPRSFAWYLSRSLVPTSFESRLRRLLARSKSIDNADGTP